MSEDALKLAQQIAHEVWEKYDDTHGYRTEKQERNDNHPTNDPDCMWFFWNQFDENNQNEFIGGVIDRLPSELAIDILAWIQKIPDL